ncbi:MAG: hypothetical protein LJE96_13470 [Deltaproteobacteria bacterium]|jgi:hypothetical protein|nr:hypothetical protein [Deltaproteobacteria bacterium]
MRKLILRGTTITVVMVLLFVAVLLGVVKNTVISHPEAHETHEEHENHEHGGGDES